MNKLSTLIVSCLFACSCDGPQPGITESTVPIGATDTVIVYWTPAMHETSDLFIYADGDLVKAMFAGCSFRDSVIVPEGAILLAEYYVPKEQARKRFTEMAKNRMTWYVR